jgi:hypothetical protein
MRRTLPLCLCGLAFVLSGCGKKSPPPVVEVSGVVLLNKQPLPNALVTFVPQLSDFGAEMNSTAVTNNKGEFKLQCAYKDQPGAVVGKHKVTVAEAPMPAKYRGMSKEAQEGAAAHLQSQVNRPIPQKYATVGTTDLEVEVEADGGQVTLNLKRP